MNRRAVYSILLEYFTDFLFFPIFFAVKYNWWYYRPISLPDEVSSSDSVTYVGSYC